MVFALLVVFAAAGMASVALTRGMAAHRESKVERGSIRGHYLAVGAAEAAKKAVIQAIANYQPVPTEGALTIDGASASWEAAATGFSTVVTDPSGIQTIVDQYRITAEAEIDGVRSRSERLINANSTPIFQFAVFYTNDLEILPGPNMTLGGRVHTNGDLFWGSNNKLTVDTNYVRAVGGIYRNRKNDPTKSSGTVDIRKWVVDPFDPSEPVEFVSMNSQSQMDALGVATTSGYDSNFTDGYDSNGDEDFDDPGDWPPYALGALDFWDEPDAYAGSGNTILSGEHAVSESVAPSIGSISMFEPQAAGDYDWDAGQGLYVAVPAGTGSFGKGYYHAQATLSIVTYDDATWDAFDGLGYDVSASLSGAVTVKSIYDARQGGNVQVTEIDVDALNGSGVFPSNGLLYAGAYAQGTGTAANGVKLVEGAELSAPLTVVTDGSVYVEGDYNTVSKKGAAVIGDAVNLLSNAWNDSKGPGQLPSASDTTFNVAMITGNHDTVGSAYNGGLENLPRFHEKWSNKKATINGSFVNTWTSQYATGSWAYGSDRYKAPIRDWAYDTAFNTVANLPPFTPMVVTAEDVVAW